MKKMIVGCSFIALKLINLFLSGSCSQFLHAGSGPAPAVLWTGQAFPLVDLSGAVWGHLEGLASSILANDRLM